MPIEPQRAAFLASALLMALGASVATWAVVAYRVASGSPTLPYVPRRRVPWGGIDLLAVLWIYFVLATAVWGLGAALGVFDSGGPKAGEAAPSANFHSNEPGAAEAPESLELAHPLVVLLIQRRSVGTVLLCALAAVVVAPIVEEFFYRLLLQGWLEATERRLRRRVAPVKRWIPGAVPVLLVSFLFAAEHFRKPTTHEDLARIAFAAVAGAVAGLSTVACAVVWIRLRTRAGPIDFGFDREKLAGDVVLGLAAFAAVAGPIYLLQLVLANLLDKLRPGLVPDPITLFFFAVLLGTLYYRTHRIVPSIVAHMALNATSLFLAWWAWCA